MKAREVRARWGLLSSALVLATSALGCGGEEWEPSGIGPRIATDTQALTDPTAGGSMHGDMLETAAPIDQPAAVSALSGDSSSSSGSHGSGDPKVFYLFYADGHPLSSTSTDACAGRGTPPKFKCSFAPTLAECQRQIQGYLDKWFADFNIVFTLTRPTSGKFYTEVISSGGGDWCGVDPRVAGVAPFLCKDIEGGVAYTFLGGEDAKQTAIIIAQEGAHLIGLEHTKSTHDLMYPTICPDCDGFVDQDLAIDGDRCDRQTQNSYEMMKNRVGVWGAGPKPSVFGCMTDDQAPGVKIMEPADGAAVASSFAVRVDARDDCDLSKVQISVTPQTLSAEARTPPFEWDLTNLSGRQTITVTAVDGAGHSAVTSITVNAPAEAPGGPDPAAMPSAGCTVASGAFSVAGLLPSLAMLLLFSRRQAPRGRRRRLVTGELGDADARPPGEEPPPADGDDAAIAASAMAGAPAQVPLRR